VTAQKRKLNPSVIHLPILAKEKLNISLQFCNENFRKMLFESSLLASQNIFFNSMIQT
jgi:hypothetical protein